MNNKRFLVTKPNYDTTTNYLSHWSSKYLEYARRKGIDFTEFKANKATRKAIDKFLKKQNPKLVVFNGHGKSNLITGHKQEVLIKVGENEELLKSKIVYAISCQSAKELGPKSIAKGTKAYIGYDDDFVFVFDKNQTCIPLNDKLAKNFLEPSNEIVISLLKGNTAKESYDKSQKMFKENINKLLTTEALPGSKNIVWWLLWDMDHQKVLGNLGAIF